VQRDSRLGHPSLAAFLLLVLGCAGSGPRSSSSGRTPDAVTNEAPSIQGRVTEKSSGRILIEEEPLDSSGSAKASVRLTRSTRILRSSGEPATIDDLQTGQRVSAWFEGPVAQSYPVQASASAIRIEAEADRSNAVEIDGIIRFHQLEGGFFAIQSREGETYNAINLPEEFRQDGLPVWAKVRIRHDMMGIHQTGQLVEIVQIKRR